MPWSSDTGHYCATSSFHAIMRIRFCSPLICNFAIKSTKSSFKPAFSPTDLLPCEQISQEKLVLITHHSLLHETLLYIPLIPYRRSSTEVYVPVSPSRPGRPRYGFLVSSLVYSPTLLFSFITSKKSTTVQPFPDMHQGYTHNSLVELMCSIITLRCAHHCSRGPVHEHL